MGRKSIVLGRDYGEVMSENVRAAILMQMVPNEIKDMIFNSIPKGDLDYGGIRNKVMTVVINRIQLTTPTPMYIGNLDATWWGEDAGGELWEEHQVDLDAMGKGDMSCYRCGGKGHMARDCPTPMMKGDKGKGDYKGKGGGGKGYQGTCWNCGKVGHKSSECTESRSLRSLEA